MKTLYVISPRIIVYKEHFGIIDVDVELMIGYDDSGKYYICSAYHEETIHMLAMPPGLVTSTALDDNGEITNRIAYAYTYPTFVKPPDSTLEKLKQLFLMKKLINLR